MKINVGYKIKSVGWEQKVYSGALRDLLPLYNLKCENFYGGVLLLVKLRGSACNFARSNTPPWGVFYVFNLYKWCQIT